MNEREGAHKKRLSTTHPRFIIRKIQGLTAYFSIKNSSPSPIFADGGIEDGVQVVEKVLFVTATSRSTPAQYYEDKDTVTQWAGV